jgi:hypothetical protein
MLFERSRNHHRWIEWWDRLLLQVSSHTFSWHCLLTACWIKSIRLFQNHVDKIWETDNAANTRRENIWKYYFEQSYRTIIPFFSSKIFIQHDSYAMNAPSASVVVDVLIACGEILIDQLKEIMFVCVCVWMASLREWHIRPNWIHHQNNSCPKFYPFIKLTWESKGGQSFASLSLSLSRCWSHSMIWMTCIRDNYIYEANIDCVEDSMEFVLSNQL